MHLDDNFLLDTCTLLWLGAGADKLEGKARDALEESKLHVSRITVWEIGNLVRKRRLALAMPPLAWFQRTVKMIGAAVPDLSLEILARSCELPGDPPNDPADRIIIATAREAGLAIATRDQKILSYAAVGHVRALAC